MDLAVPYNAFSDLRPGGGWASATPTPAAVGDSGAAGYAENVIARADFVPYQTFAGTFTVAVAAFHREGTGRVDFSVDGGVWRRVSGMTTGHGLGHSLPMYWTTVNAARFSDGPHQIRCRVIPLSGVPRVLSGLYFNANSGGTLPALTRYVAITGDDTTGDGTSGNPYATILKAALSIKTAQGSADGATIYCANGDYTWHGIEFADDNIPTTNQYLTITAAPGASKASVRITANANNGDGANDGLNTKLVCFRGITLLDLPFGSSKTADHCWLDDVAMIGPGRYAGPSFRESQFDHKYFTGCTATDMQDAPDGGDLWRNCTLSTLAQSGFHNSPLVVNCSVSGINPGGDGTLHPDCIQHTTSTPNAIYYGVTVNETGGATGIRLQPDARDVAFVGCSIATDAVYLFEMERPYRHLYFKGCTLNGAFTYDGTFSATNVVFDGCTFPSGSPAAHAGVTIR
jgi:hypothetical protein